MSVCGWLEGEQATCRVNGWEPETPAALAGRRAFGINRDGSLEHGIACAGPYAAGLKGNKRPTA